MNEFTTLEESERELQEKMRKKDLDAAKAEKKPTPQLENGYISVATELVEQFQHLHLSGNEWQVLWSVLRKTWGWRKKEDSISLTQFEKMTGLRRARVVEALTELVRKSVLVAKKEGFINIYSFNKQYENWNSTEKRTSPENSTTPSPEKRTRVVRKSVPKLVRKSGHTINTTDTITTDTTTKESKYPKVEDVKEEDLNEISEKYNLPIAFVKSKYDDLCNWYEEKPNDKSRKNRNWRATLINWVKRDAEKIALKSSAQNSKYSVTKV